MTVREIKAFVDGIDPGAKHYYTTLDGNAYTVWAETERTGLAANNTLAEMSWKFRVIRYTQAEFDAMAEAIEEALLEHPVISYSYSVDADPATGYILHTFECEA